MCRVRTVLDEGANHQCQHNAGFNHGQYQLRVAGVLDTFGHNDSNDREPYGCGKGHPIGAVLQACGEALVFICHACLLFGFVSLNQTLSALGDERFVLNTGRCGWVR